MGDADIERLIAVNYTMQVRVTRALLPVLLEQGGGAIAFTGSLSSYVYSPMHSVYTGTKGALNGFVAAVRRELPPDSGVQLTIIHPNMTRTNIAAQELFDLIESKYPLQTAGQVAGAFLDGVAHGRREVFVVVTDHLFKWAEWLAPAAVDYLFRWGISDEMKERAEAIASETRARAALSDT
jgi:short-subunit dehydrogenase